MTTTSTEFIADIKRLITLPANQSRFTDLDIMAFGDRKMADTMVPVIDSLVQEYFVTRTRSPIIAGQTSYAIPVRALGRKFRDLKLVGPSGGRSDFPKIAVEREQFYRANGTPFGWYFMGDHIEIVPTPQASGFELEFWWFIPPGKIISPSVTVTVQGIDTLTGEVTVSPIPPNLIVGSIIDFIQGVSGNSTIGLDKPIAGILGNIMIFAPGDIPVNPPLALGDYISLTGTSPVLQIPDSAEPYLVTLTAMEILQAIGDFEGRDALKETRDMQDKNLKMLLEPRVEGEATPIINDYGFVGGPRRGLWGMWNGSV